MFYDQDEDDGDLMDETTSPTSTAPSPTNATPPMTVEESQGLDAWGCFRRAFRLLVGVVRAGRMKERDDEDNTNPIDFRLIVSLVAG